MSLFNLRNLLPFFLLFILVMFSGCVSIPKPPDIKYQIHEAIRQNPVTAVSPSGEKFQVYTQTEHVYDVNYEKQDKPLSVWQKFCNWLSGLGILGILGIVAGLILAPGGTMAFILKRYWAFKKALTQTVKAIDEAKIVDNNPEVKATLAAAMDNDSKKLVDDIKRTV